METTRGNVHLGRGSISAARSRLFAADEGEDDERSGAGAGGRISLIVLIVIAAAAKVSS